MMSRKRVILLAALGVLSYLIFLAASFPAARAWAWFGEGRLPVEAYGLSGSVWSGQAAAMINGPRRVEALQWDLAPLSVLSGRIAGDVQARLGQDGLLRGQLTVGRESLRAQELKFELPATAVLEWAELKGRLPVKVDGRFDAFLKTLVVQQGRVTEADGVLNWHNANLRLGSKPLPLGNVALRLEPAGDAIKGTLVNQGSPIELTGDLNLAPDGRFVLDLSARAAGPLDEATQQIFTMANIPTDGSPVKARLTGTLDGNDVRLEPVAARETSDNSLEPLRSRRPRLST